MKQYYTYLFGILIAGSVFSACKKDEPTLFEQEYNGFYFDYASTDDLSTSINFSSYVLTNPESVDVPVKIKLLGRLSDGQTRIQLKSRAVEGYPEAQVTIPEVILEPGEYEKTVSVTVAKPAEEGVEYAASLYFEDNAGIEDFEVFQLKVSESYNKPSSWDYGASMYYGEWSTEKYKFIAMVLQDAEFYNNYNTLYSNEGNPKVVSAIRAYHQEHPDEPIIDVPIVSDGNLSYEKPYYWGDLQDQYLGAYSSAAFQGLCSSAGITTANEEEELSGDETKMKEVNKKAVTVMMNTYNSNYPYGWRFDPQSYKNMMWVPLFADTDYEVVTPIWWEDESLVNPNTNMTAKDMIEKYYGTYSADKYKFMINTYLEEVGQGNFVLASLFPIISQWGEYDPYPEWGSGFGTGDYTGERSIYQLYLLFKERSAGTGIDFPDDVPDPAPAP